MEQEVNSKDFPAKLIYFVDADRFRAATQQQTNLMDTVNQQNSENINVE